MAYGTFNAGAGACDASEVLYDSAKSGLDADSLQDAVDLLAGAAFPKLTVTVATASTVTVSMGSDSMSADIAANGSHDFQLTGTGTWTVTAVQGEKTKTQAVSVDSIGAYTVEFPVEIYGASWDGTSTTAWTRTDLAADFTDPVPYVAGTSSYGSPFDNIQPWAGMVVSENAEAGSVVAIPKFYYSLTQNGNGMSIRISTDAVDGFACSPAHMDRGDGKGERDVIYVGRYHCASDYKSTTGVNPAASKTRATFRTGIAALGDTVWQWDWATRFTIWLLYLVEFANWNSQNCIGQGCSTSGSKMTMGYTDDMPYCTGTTASALTSYGGTQYRNIEGLWDNVYDWLDGCYNSNGGLNLILNPSAFSDTEGGTSIGVPSSGYPSRFTVSDAAGFTAFRPSSANGSASTYSCDYWYFDASDPCVYAGGYCHQYAYFGLFYLSYVSVPYSSDNIGSRLLVLP